jgi:hypothetical protein
LATARLATKAKAPAAPAAPAGFPDCATPFKFPIIVASGEIYGLPDTVEHGFYILSRNACVLSDSRGAPLDGGRYQRTLKAGDDPERIARELHSAWRGERHRGRNDGPIKYGPKGFW